MVASYVRVSERPLREIDDDRGGPETSRIKEGRSTLTEIDLVTFDKLTRDV